MHLNYYSYGPYAANNKMVTRVNQILKGEDDYLKTSFFLLLF